jgi:hypothetical protein
MISRQFKRSREGHPVHIASAFVLLFMGTIFLTQLAAESFCLESYVLWKLAFYFASTLYLGNLCTGPNIYVNFLYCYKCTAYFMGLVACMIDFLLPSVIHVFTIY